MPGKTAHAKPTRRIKQQPYCCVPACIQMVMRAEKLPLVSQKRLGKAFGLVTPPAPRPPSGYGTRLQLEAFEPNAVFQKLHIPLRFSWKLIDQLTSTAEYKKLIKDHLPTKHLLVCFDWPSLFQTKSPNHWGHVCILEKVDLQKNTAQLLDPDPFSTARHTVPLQQLVRSMRIHSKKNLGGIWVLERVQEA